MGIVFYQEKDIPIFQQIGLLLFMLISNFLSNYLFVYFIYYGIIWLYFLLIFEKDGGQPTANHTLQSI